MNVKHKKRDFITEIKKKKLKLSVYRFSSWSLIDSSIDYLSINSWLTFCTSHVFDAPTLMEVIKYKEIETGLFQVADLHPQNAMSFYLQNYIHHAKEYLSLFIPQFISCSGISISSYLQSILTFGNYLYLPIPSSIPVSGNIYLFLSL